MNGTADPADESADMDMDMDVDAERPANGVGDAEPEGGAPMDVDPPGESRRFDPLADESDDSRPKPAHGAPDADCSNDSASVGKPVNNFNNDSVNSDSVGSSNAKHKTDSGSDEDSEPEGTSEVHEIRSDSENDRGKPVTVNDEDSDEEVDSEEDSSDDEGSEPSDAPPEDGSDEGPVSIHSDSDPESQNPGDVPAKSKKTDRSNEVLLIDDASNQGDKPRDGVTSPTIHEITSDNDDIVVSGDKSDKKSSPRRSSRIMDKRSTSHRSKFYDDDDEEDESDIEEIVSDPLNSKNKNTTIVINNTKKLVDLALIKQNGKANSSGNQKKEPTVVIIDTNSVSTTKTQVPIPPKNPFANLQNQNLYESMAARGTTVTPLSTKPAAAPTPLTASAPPPIILPSLTDDMFVVEAPSFIVPYVYEKPSLKPFREFVDILGKELDEQIKKEEHDRLEKERELREKLNLDRKEKEVPAAPVPEKVKEKEKEKEKVLQIDESASLDARKLSKRNRRKKKDDDDASWDGESTTDSDEEGMSDDDRPKTVIIKEKDDDSLDAIKDPMINDLTLTSSKDAPKTNSYFDNSLGKFFINIGMNLVQEFVQSDLLRQQKRKLQRENRAGSGNIKATECAINSLMKNLEFSKENNAPYKHQMKKCEFCCFKTESALALANHMEKPHMKNGVYKCNFCQYEVRSPHDILFHMEAEHNTRGRLERAPSYHQCPNCPFEDNGKGKLGRHLIACAKKFRPDYNLMPPIDWEPPAKIPKATHVRQNVMSSSYQSVFAKMQPTPMSSTILPPMNRGRGRPQMMPSLKPVQGSPMIRSGVMLRQSTPGMIGNAANHIPKVLQHQPSISITPLPRTPQSTSGGASITAVPSGSNNSSGNKSTFVICEICDGYIKDLEQLRNHMQWIHKVKIHPKMIYNRPPLNCQKCQFRFFTDQGLERHLLGSHGLVTSSMQEAANKSNDSGRCPICGRVYQWKLLNHVQRDHNLTLKPAHLSYKCTVCTATFGMYRQFENHVYSAHSNVAKRNTRGPGAAGGGAAASSSKAAVTSGGSLLKPIN